MKTKGKIAVQLALEKGLINIDQIYQSQQLASWDLSSFLNAIGAGQEFLDEVIKIQQENKKNG
jgi:hypothetical protein